MSVIIRVVAAGDHRKDRTAVKQPMSDLNVRAVVEVEARTRPTWSRCASAPHSIEVAVFRPESRYHRLVFTAPEWATFVANVRAGLYNVVEATQLHGWAGEESGKFMVLSGRSRSESTRSAVAEISKLGVKFPARPAAITKTGTAYGAVDVIFEK